jgi:hypothetical protein
MAEDLPITMYEYAEAPEKLRMTINIATFCDAQVNTLPMMPVAAAKCIEALRPRRSAILESCQPIAHELGKGIRHTS